ncbi:SCP-domain-containing protein [Linderina pennispora]|uniref:SCP-domain-containing protein n=1 Tax=Linderina pennispora TaxID=61395 RepID=A0A1Y1WL79_9FUNG|nr:SCP-domain-containing protein [Linderina pennispora]ORX74115.1 SCP-domain-containing protein [Linderina pennispora]
MPSIYQAVLLFLGVALAAPVADRDQVNVLGKKSFNPYPSGPSTQFGVPSTRFQWAPMPAAAPKQPSHLPVQMPSDLLVMNWQNQMNQFGNSGRTGQPLPPSMNTNQPSAATNPSSQPIKAPLDGSSTGAQGSYSGSGWQEQMLQLVNAERARYGKQPLRLDAGLSSAAQAHSDYQSSIRTMTHNNPNGDIMQRISPYVSGARSAAENVAFNQRSVEQVMQSWIQSPGHHTNIIGDYNAVGFGQRDWYWTQQFASL